MVAFPPAATPWRRQRPRRGPTWASGRTGPGDASPSGRATGRASGHALPPSSLHHTYQVHAVVGRGRGRRRGRGRDGAGRRDAAGRQARRRRPDRGCLGGRAGRRGRAAGGGEGESHYDKAARRGGACDTEGACAWGGSAETNSRLLCGWATFYLDVSFYFFSSLRPALSPFTPFTHMPALHATLLRSPSLSLASKSRRSFGVGSRRLSTTTAAASPGSSSSTPTSPSPKPGGMAGLLQGLFGGKVREGGACVCVCVCWGWRGDGRGARAR